jgi:hypothetical protein
LFQSRDKKVPLSCQLGHQQQEEREHVGRGRNEKWVSEEMKKGKKIATSRQATETDMTIKPLTNQPASQPANQPDMPTAVHSKDLEPYWAGPQHRGVVGTATMTKKCSFWVNCNVID